jgi:hypothetical protein
MLSEGYFRLYQVNAYEDEATTKYERLYERSAGGQTATFEFDGYSVDIFNTNFPHVEAGGQFQWFAPLKNGYLKMPFVQLNMLDEGDSMPLVSGKYIYSQNLREPMIGGASKRLNLSGALNLDIRKRSQNHEPPNEEETYPLTTGYWATVHIKIKVGNYYLKYEPFAKIPQSWTTNSADRVILAFPNLSSGWSILNYAIQTIELPNVNPLLSNEFSIEVNRITNDHFVPYIEGGTTYWSSITLIPVTDFFVHRCIGRSSLVYNPSSTNENEQYFEYIGGNTSTPVNSYDIEFNEALFGETPDPSYPGRLFVSADNIIFGQSTSKWKINGVGTAFDFNILRVREVMSGQFRPCLKYQNSILGQLLPHNAIEYAGFRMIYNGGTFSAMSDKLNGEWFAVSLDRPSWAEIQGAVAQAGNGGETQFQRQFGEIGGEVQNINVYLENTAGGVKVYDAYDSISVEYVSGNYFCNTANQTFTMPSAADMVVNGFSSEIYFKNICSGSGDKVYVIPISGQTIDGEESLELKQFESVVIISDGNNLYLKSTHKPA